MNKVSIIKIIVAALFITSAGVCFFSVVKFNSIGISVVDMVNMSSDITSLMDEFGASSELIKQEVSSYFIYGIFLFALPVVAAACVLIIRGKLAFVAAICGTLINNVVAFIIYDKLSQMIQLIDQAASFLSLDMDIGISKGAVAFWATAYGLILILSAAGLTSGIFQKRASYPAIRTILPEDISEPVAVNAQQNQLNHFSSQPKYPGFFYGGIIGRAGIYREKIRLFEKGEQFALGADGPGCSIKYDEILQEYQLQPQEVKCVFLQSGQPLGKNRIYCLPRGTVIQLNENQFELA